MIHETAIIDPSAQIADDVEIGPWTYIGPDVSIDSGTWVGSHVVIKGPTTIGKNNKIYPYASVGDDPQDLKFNNERTFLTIGDSNTIREYCTINRGTEQGGSYTKIGNHNLLMAYVHVAHDCIIGNHTIFANNASLSGHVTVCDHVIMSGFSAAHQFTTLGEHSFIAHSTMVVKDVLPYVLVSGDPAKPYGLNSVGLKRRGFVDETIAQLKRAYKIIYRQGLTVVEAVDTLSDWVSETPEIEPMIHALQHSSRGISR